MTQNDSKDPLKKNIGHENESTDNQDRAPEEEILKENSDQPTGHTAGQGPPEEGESVPASGDSEPASGEKEPENASPDPPDKESERLVDDDEEELKNTSYDEYDQDENDGSDSGDGQKEEAGEERVNYSLLSKEDLVKLMREKLNNPAKGNIRKDVGEIKRAFYDKHHAGFQEKKEQFLREGGEPEDFKPVDDPLEKAMKDLLREYRSMKAEFSRQLEQSKMENLQKKQDVLAEMKILMEAPEVFEATFRKFKDLQRKWFSAGVVPHQNLKDLWNSYNYYVEKFNDYVRINRELRALDLKKNLEMKLQLCEKAEALDQESDVVQAFRTLQKYHARWREIGPVPREEREALWNRFKKATSVINRKHQEHHSRLKESLQENLRKKEELCEKVEAIADTEYNSHKAWVDKTNEVLAIQKTWKTIGYAPKKENNAIYARFRRACDKFFDRKAKFYSAAYEDQKENMKRKIGIIEEAEALSESEDWKETSSKLIRLQKQWKKTGPVPRRESDKLWKRFRAACDKFFNRKSAFYENIDSRYEENLKAKNELIGLMESFEPTGDRDKDIASLEEFHEKFNQIGFVPVEEKDTIKEKYRKAQDALMERLNLNEFDRSVLKFRNRVEGMLRSPKSEMKLGFERDKLTNKLQQLRSDLSVWENNVGFIKQSDSSEDTIQEFHEKIGEAQERIRVLEAKIRILDDMENAN